MSATKWVAADGAWETTLRGRQLLSDPELNRGGAFTPEQRHQLGLVGLLPPRTTTLAEQAGRAYEQFSSQPTNLAKNVFLSLLAGRNEVLFHRLVADHLREMLPIVYTPTIGEAIEHYSQEFRRPKGIFLSVDHTDEIEESLRAPGLGPDEVDLIVATDGEAILGIGDWGVGGVNISIGKLAVYTATAGVDPGRTLAVMLDVGTNRESLLQSPLYLGNRHPRVDETTYDSFIDAFVSTATTLFPRALIHWEDLGTANARRVLLRYRDKIFTFNDDIQGTGAMTLAAVLSGLRVVNESLPAQTVVIYGAGTAGIGVADQLRDAMVEQGTSPLVATSRIWCVDRHGLLLDSMTDLREFQRPYARSARTPEEWGRATGDDRAISLDEVVRRVRPTVLIGTSTDGGAFDEPLVREMAASCERPIILPMSNPTELAEGRPADLIAWTGGRALVATGSPFDPVVYGGTTYLIGQANNALIFPGLGLGSILVRASRITDAMVHAAATAVADAVDARPRGASLLPDVEDLRDTSAAVAAAVARAAVSGGVATVPLPDDLDRSVREAMWEPDYRSIRAVG